MKKILIIIVTIIAVLAVGYYIKTRNVEIQETNYPMYHCDNRIMPTNMRFWIKKQKDNQYHLIIASKPPQTDIVVTRTEHGLLDYSYSGDGIDVRDSTSSLQVTYNGTQLENCRRIYPGK